MNTAKEHIYAIKDERIRALLLERTLDANMREKFNSINDVISCGFIWGESPEGVSKWSVLEKSIKYTNSIEEAFDAVGWWDEPLKEEHIDSMKKEADKIKELTDEEIQFNSECRELWRAVYTKRTPSNTDELHDDFAVQAADLAVNEYKKKFKP